jgi:glycine/D-amino acid oxidase-like deaminating enzyme
MTTISLRRPWRHAPAAAERSHWLAETLASDRERSPALAGDVRCNVCVVGGGFTGLWTALELQERAPGTSVCLLEGDVCGGGASGVNAGYVMNLWPKFLGLTAMASTDEALMLGQASADAVEQVLDFVAADGTDVGLRRAPWLWAATNAAQLGAWDETLEALSGAGVAPLREIGATEAQALAQSDTHAGGIVDEACASLQPAALARALRRAAIAAGVQVHEGTPALSIEAARRTVVRTPSGRVDAEQVVLAINAWAAQLGDVGRKLVMVASDTFVTPPIPAALEALGWQDGTAVSDSRRRLNYYRTTPEGRLLYGKGGVGVGFGTRAADATWGPSPRLPELRRHLARSFPSLAGVAVERSWTAPVEYSVSSLPFCGALPGAPNVRYVTGYSGDGVGPSRMMARIVSSLVLGERNPLSESVLARPPQGKLPPEPLRWLGSRAVMPALARLEDCEDRGQRPRALVRRLATIDPTGFVG